MAAIASETVNITINDVELAVPKGELIVEAVKRLGLEIPIFCYHQRMKPVGMCRMCLVEVGFKQPDGSVRKMPKPQAGCTLPASEGMAIFTDSEMVHRDRRGVLEFLLVNHPLDCPICDRGGECPLQNNTIFYGPSTSRYVEIKRHLPKAFPLSEYVTLDLERCIQCGRCVRFTEEISGDGQLAFRFRGAQMQPSTFELKNFDSKFSGNVIEICPVGALTSSKYRFRARPWDLETREAICTECSNGCNIWMDHRLGRMVRVNGRTNEAVNEEWTCDKGKFGHDYLNEEGRLASCFIRHVDKLVASQWSEIYTPILEAFSNKKGAVAAIVGPKVSNESLYMLKKLFAEQFGSSNIDFRFTKHLPSTDQSLQKRIGQKDVQSSIASLEFKSSILVFGTSLADDSPITFLRVRKAWFQNAAKVVVAHDSTTEADSFAHLVLRYKPGTAHILASGLLAEAVRIGNSKVPDATKKSIEKFTLDYVSKETGVAAESISEAVAILDSGSAFLTTHSIFNEPEAQDTYESLGGYAMTLGAEFNCHALGANSQGAIELGLGEAKNTREILEACAKGTIKALWLAGIDLYSTGLDRELVEKALENVEFLVVHDVAETDSLPFASIALPMTAPAEEEGSWTNAERRVQSMTAVLKPYGEAKAAWRTFGELALRAKPSRPYFSAAEVFDEIVSKTPAFEGLSYASLNGEGKLLK